LSINNVKTRTTSALEVDIIDEIETSKIAVDDDYYNSINKPFLSDVIAHYRSMECEVKLKINNRKDIIIGFVYTNKTNLRNLRSRYLKDLFVLRNIDGERKLLIVRIAPEFLE
jgi:hypothetical protein